MQAGPSNNVYFDIQIMALVSERMGELVACLYNKLRFTSF